MKKPKSKSGITRALHSSPNRYTDVLIETNIRSIRSIVFPSPVSLSDIASIPNRSIQKHWLLRKPLLFLLLLLPSHHLPIDHPLDRIATPVDRIHVKPIGAIEPKIVDLLSFPSPRRVEVCLHDGLVFPQKFEVDLVLGFVAFEGGKVDVEIEAAGVAFGALDEGAEGAVVEAGGGAPPCAAAVVVGEGDGVGFRAVGTCFWSVIDGDLFEGLGVVVVVRLRVKNRISHWRKRRESEKNGV